MIRHEFIYQRYMGEYMVIHGLYINTHIYIYIYIIHKYTAELWGWRWRERERKREIHVYIHGYRWITIWQLLDDTCIYIYAYYGY